MKSQIILIALIMCVYNLFGQNEMPDTSKTINLQEVIVTANKLPVLLKMI